LRCKQQLEQEKPLREMEMSADEKKLIRGFMFLSQKPMLFVLNIAESTTLGADLENAVARYKLEEVASRPNAGATAICGKVEAELAEMSDEEAAKMSAVPGPSRYIPAPRRPPGPFIPISKSTSSAPKPSIGIPC
jgi:ribosome-binding ATPase YchF (GTP1/OBG family)